jgi:hypothetical protein
MLRQIRRRRADNRTDPIICDAFRIERVPIAIVKFPVQLHERFPEV